MKLLNSSKIPIILFCFVGVLVLIFTNYLINTALLSVVFKKWTYYLIWIAICTLFYLLNKTISFVSLFTIENFKKNCTPFLISLGLTILIFLVVTPEFRIIADETNLLNVSQAFYYTKEFSHPVESEYFYESLHFINPVIPHRPGLWPFFASILHVILGYSEYNAFLLNFLVMFATLVTLIYIGEILLSRTLGYIAAILLATYPIYALNATSGGFDPINLLFLLWVGLALYKFIIKPEGNSFEILLILFVLNAQCRYESVILIIPILIAFVWKYRPNQIKHNKYIFPFFPILFLPILWQKILSPELVNEGDAGKIAMEWSNIPEHASNAWEFFFDKGSPEYPNNPLVGILALLGILLMSIHIYKSIRDKELLAGVSLVLFGSVLIACIHFAYYLGDYRLPFIMRYSVAHLGYISLLAAYPIYFAYQFKLWKIQSVLLVAFIIITNLPVATNNERGKILIPYRDFKTCRKYIESLNTKNIMVIAGRPSTYTALGVGSVNFGYANSYASQMLNNLNRHLFQNIFVIQHIRYSDQLPVEKLDPNFALETVLEFQNSEVDYVRIAKVVN